MVFNSLHPSSAAPFVQERIGHTMVFNSQYCSLTPSIPAPGDHTHLHLRAILQKRTVSTCDCSEKESSEKPPAGDHDIALTVTKETPLHE